MERLWKNQLTPGNPGDAGQIRGLLQRPPETMRQVVVLTYMAGYTCAETASLLAVREGTVKSSLS